MKRSADQAVSLGNDITDLNSFFTNVRENLKNVEILGIEENKISEIEETIPKTLKTFPGTMSVHQAVYKRDIPFLRMRRLSCYECLDSVCKHYEIGQYDITNIPKDLGEREKEQSNAQGKVNSKGGKRKLQEKNLTNKNCKKSKPDQRKAERKTDSQGGKSKLPEETENCRRSSRKRKCVEKLDI